MSVFRGGWKQGWIVAVLVTSVLAGRWELAKRAAAQSIVTSASAQFPYRGGYYLGASTLRLAPLLASPPAADSHATKEELAELHALEAGRTPGQVKAAQADDAEEDMWVYRTVFGREFGADKLPLTAVLQGHVLTEATAAASNLKDTFLRVRPYRVDLTLHPVCQATTTGKNSYPSGHTLVGYLMALVLAEIIPERQQEILTRAAEYGHNRMVCGVHYASDVEAGKLASYTVFGELMRSPPFVADLQAARGELRQRLKLPAMKP